MPQTSVTDPVEVQERLRAQRDEFTTLSAQLYEALVEVSNESLDLLGDSLAHRIRVACTAYEESPAVRRRYGLEA